MENRLIVKFSQNREQLEVEFGNILDSSYNFVEDAVSAIGNLYLQEKVNLVQVEHSMMKLLNSTNNLQTRKKGKFSLLFLINSFVPMKLGNIYDDFSEHVYLEIDPSGLKYSFRIKMDNEDLPLSDFFMCTSNAKDFLNFLLKIEFIDGQKFIELDYLIRESSLILSN